MKIMRLKLAWRQVLAQNLPMIGLQAKNEHIKDEIN